MDIARTELHDNITKFINEIDIAFDYIPKEIIKKLKNYQKTLLANHSKEIDLYNKLSPIQSDININSNTKLKNISFDFLNNVKLFDDIMDFNLFNSEHKSTKKVIVKYLYNIFMCVFILQFNDSNDSIKQFLSGIQEQIESQRKQEQQQQEKEQEHKQAVEQYRQKKIEKGGIEEMINSLLTNPMIQSLANDITSDLKNEHINHMSLLESLMSGKPDNKLLGLIEKLSEKLETKMKNGELDKDMLENEAKNLINNLSNSNLPIPDAVKNILQNFKI